MKRDFNSQALISSCVIVLLASVRAFSAVTNALMMNEVNMVAGENFLESNKIDSTLGRVQGNGQNWWEFIVVAGDSGKNTLDLRGWTIDWSYHKLHDRAPADPLPHTELHKYGNGTITFSNDVLWAAVPRGTLLTVSEWQDVWYNSTPDGTTGYTRAGGISGVGTVHGVPYSPNDHVKIGANQLSIAGPNPLFTNTSWNPGSNGSGTNGDWRLHVFAGERNQDNSYKYFSFTGEVTDGLDTFGQEIKYAIGTDEAGLFAINNDLWRYTIKDAQGNVIQGPIGEWDPNADSDGTNTTYGAGVPGGDGSVSAVEIFRLEAFNQNQNPQQSNYLNATLANYQDGSTGTFGAANAWSSNSVHQGLNGLRSWLRPGDANLDGAVDGADYVLLRKNQGAPGGWTQGNFNGDGTIDAADFTIWRANFTGTASGAGSLAEGSVPEPGALLLATIGMAGACARVRRRRS